MAARAHLQSLLLGSLRQEDQSLNPAQATRQDTRSSVLEGEEGWGGRELHGSALAWQALGPRFHPQHHQKIILKWEPRTVTDSIGLSSGHSAAVFPALSLEGGGLCLIPAGGDMHTTFLKERTRHSVLCACRGRQTGRGMLQEPYCCLCRSGPL